MALIMNSRSELLAIIRVRRHLIREGKCYKNVVLCMRTIAKLDGWLKAYPHATDRQVRNFARRHFEQFKFLIPSSTHPSHLAMEENLTKLISQSHARA
jgi:hypothetical protein